MKNMTTTSAVMQGIGVFLVVTPLADAFSPDWWCYTLGLNLLVALIKVDI